MKHIFGGIFGTVTAFTLHDFSECASIAAAVATVVYMVIASAAKLNKGKKPNEKNQRHFKF